MVPQNPDGIVRVYHCGPTVYSAPHLGNLRRFLVADLLVRVLRFLGYRVRSVMNITDVGHLHDAGHSAEGEDRILVAAEREGQPPEHIAAKYTAEFFAALASLRAEPADYYPRATMHIREMQGIIRRLLDRGVAYVTPSGVYLDVTKVQRYGKLSGNTIDAIQAGARIGVREEKRHPADFALWIFAPADHLMQWGSPWGRGYPGWHIECSAMSMQILGERIDIHTGGRDNIFPHHENEITQSEGATGEPFARYWVHNEFLELKDQKMSKSEGETITLTDLARRGVDPLAFRLLSLQTHYRSKLSFSWESLDGAASALRGLRTSVSRLANAQSGPDKETRSMSGTEGWGPQQIASRFGGVPQGISDRLRELEQTFSAALADDLNSPQALAAVFDFLRDTNARVQQGELGREDTEAMRATFRKLDTVLAILDPDTPLPSPDIPAEVQTLVEDRENARQRLDFAAADTLRETIRARGFTVEDTPQGPRVIVSPSGG